MNEISIRTDKGKNDVFFSKHAIGEYIGGETIFGTVFLRVVQPFTAHSLFLEIKGYEKGTDAKFVLLINQVYWQYQTQESYQDNGQTKFRTVVK